VVEVYTASGSNDRGAGGGNGFPPTADYGEAS